MIFGDHEFISASVTDQPPPPTLTEALPTVTDMSLTEAEPMETDSVPSAPSTSQAQVDSVPSTSQVSTESLPSINRVISQSEPSMSRVSPQQLLPLPKASARKPSNRRKVTSAIVTDTPEKERLESEIQERMDKKRKKPRAARKLCRQKEQESSTEEKELPKGVLGSDSDSPDEVNSDAEQEMTSTNVKPGVYVLAKFVTTKKTNKFYVGEIKSEVEGSYEVRFMRKVKESAASFVFPDKDDTDLINFNDIILVLGYPITLLGTKRAASKVMFRVDISGFPIE